MTLPLPGFAEDLAAIVYPPPALKSMGVDSAGVFHFRLESETGGKYLIQTSSDWRTWSGYLLVTNTSGTVDVTAPGARTNPQSLFRARQER